VTATSGEAKGSSGEVLHGLGIVRNALQQKKEGREIRTHWLTEEEATGGGAAAFLWSFGREASSGSSSGYRGCSWAYQIGRRE
jgi:hypothetical protein